MRILFIFLIIVCVSCGDRKNKNYHEMITEYENHYRSDSLLESVILKEFNIKGNSQDIIAVRKFEYEYEFDTDELITQYEYEIILEEKQLKKITNFSPQHKEIVEFQGKDTTSYELKCFDSEGFLVHHIVRHKGNFQSFELNYDNIGSYYYFYDELGRVSHTLTSMTISGDEMKSENRIYYKGNTEEIVSEKWTELLSGINIITEYKTVYKADTLIQEAYIDGELEQKIITKIPDYKSEISFEKGSAVMQEEELLNGNLKIEVFHDFMTSRVDSVYYENDLVIREVTDMEDMKTIHYTEYDSKGNKILQRQQIWLKDEK